MGAESPQLSVLIDENLGASIAELFRARGYRAYQVGEVLPRRSPDISVTAAALDRGAVVVTMDRHFRRWKEAAAAEQQRGKLESADRILFKRCTHAEAPGRIAALIEVIEAEYRMAKRANQKFMIHITPHSYTVFR